ncbi:MAG: NAD(P)/FAD-dependent oxidoreductase [Myxococcaceae bacterium]|nr:NAD(P)/FAD-dependent oxidoreductase [Myxococcaceae bacterium]
MDSCAEERETEVLVVGAGPAGATAALNLAPLRRVVLVERRPDTPTRIGESLPPAARRLLTDMGLFEAFLAEGHAPCFGNRSVWGGPEPVETDSLRDPDGPGWHLDRARFEGWLRRVAVARGADLLAPAQLEGVEQVDGHWRVRLSTARGPMELRAQVLIDAGGRAAPVARRLGASRPTQDRLVCGWVHGRDGAEGGAGLTFIEAVEDGWWYTAPLPERRRVLAFHSDADLPAAHGIRDRNALLARAMLTRELGAVLSSAGFTPDTEVGFTAAHSATLYPFAGSGWLAVGDAALAFDPLSSQGLLNSLFTGLAAAEATDRHLSGAVDALPGYARTLEGVHAAYRRHLRLWYGMETRWPESPFWQRRQQPELGAASRTA